MKIMAALTFGLLGAALCHCASAAPLPARGTYIYSNACETEGGDFGNFRVTLTHGAKGVQVIVEFNDDGPDGRAQARNVEFSPVNGGLHFSYVGSESDAVHHFSGTVSRESLSGQFDGDKAVLPAIRAIPKTLPAC